MKKNQRETRFPVENAGVLLFACALVATSIGFALFISSFSHLSADPRESALDFDVDLASLGFSDESEDKESLGAEFEDFESSFDELSLADASNDLGFDYSDFRKTQAEVDEMFSEQSRGRGDEIALIANTAGAEIVDELPAPQMAEVNAKKERLYEYNPLDFPRRDATPFARETTRVASEGESGSSSWR